MAKYNVTYSCGCSATVQLVGSHKDREYKLKQMSEGLCPECYAKMMAEKRAQQSAIDAQSNNECGMPALTGTAKQIAWAETIRKAWYKYFIEKMQRMTGDAEAAKAQVMSKFSENKDIVYNGKAHITPSNDIYRFIATQVETEASYFIDNRYAVNY